MDGPHNHKIPTGVHCILKHSVKQFRNFLLQKSRRKRTRVLENLVSNPAVTTCDWVDLGEGVDPIVLTPVVPTSSAGVRSRGTPPKGEHRRGARYACWPSWTTTPLSSSARQQPHRGTFRAHRSPQPLWQEPASFMCGPWTDVSINCQLRVCWPHWRFLCDSTFHLRRLTAPRLN